MMTNEIIRQNGLFVDEIDVEENNFEKGMYPIIGHYNYKAKDEEVKATPGYILLLTGLIAPAGYVLLTKKRN